MQARQVRRLGWPDDHHLAVCGHDTLQGRSEQAPFGHRGLDLKDLSDWQGQPPPGSSASSASRPVGTTAVTGLPSWSPRHSAASMDGGRLSGAAGRCALG